MILARYRIDNLNETSTQDIILASVSGGSVSSDDTIEAVKTPLALVPGVSRSSDDTRDTILTPLALVPVGEGRGVDHKMIQKHLKKNQSFEK